MPSPSRKASEQTEGLWTSWLARFQGAAVGVALTAVAPAAMAQPAPPPVTVAAPLARPVTEWQEHTGRVEPSARVDIRARVSGQVDAVHFTDGAIVRQGDLLFTIDQRPFSIALDTARADVARNEARLLLAEQQVARYEPLAASRIAPQAELDARRSALREAQAGLAAARAAEQQAALDLEFTEIRATRAGRISDRRVDAGNLVQAGQTLLTTLVALDPVYVTFDASEAEYLRQARAAQGRLRNGRLPVQLRLLDEADFSPRGPCRLRGQRLRPAQRHHPRPRRGAERRPVPDAGQLRARPPVDRRGAGAAGAGRRGDGRPDRADGADGRC
jgi:multidrug efflux system membrane fusion protein